MGGEGAFIRVVLVGKKQENVHPSTFPPRMLTCVFAFAFAFASLLFTKGVFMVQTIRNVNPSQPKLLPFAGVMTVLQILVMWWFTSGVVFVAPIIAGKVGKGGMGGRRGMGGGGGGGGGGGRTRDEAIEDVEGGPDDIHDDDGGK